MANRNNDGYEKGELCSRDGCQGIIQEHDSEECCSCHINPPCSYCTTCRAYCPVCEWDGMEEQVEAEQKITEQYYATEYDGLSVRQSKETETYHHRIGKMIRGELPRPNTLEYNSLGHTHSSMIKEGVYPSGMTIDELEKQVIGSWGGRFEILNKTTGHFKYISYTD